MKSFSILGISGQLETSRKTGDWLSVSVSLGGEGFGVALGQGNQTEYAYPLQDNFGGSQTQPEQTEQTEGYFNPYHSDFSNGMSTSQPLNQSPAASGEFDY